MGLSILFEGVCRIQVLWYKFCRILWRADEGGWLVISWLTLLHHPPTAWIASLVAIYPNLVCGEGCSCTRMGRSDTLLAFLAGCFLGASEAIIFRVPPSAGTIGLMLASLNGVVMARSRESPGKWRAVRAVFLVAWVVSYWCGRLWVRHSPSM